MLQVRGNSSQSCFQGVRRADMSGQESLGCGNLVYLPLRLTSYLDVIKLSWTGKKNPHQIPDLSR